MAKDLIKEIERQIVHTDSIFSVDDKFEDSRFMRVRIAAMHSGTNRNNSRFSTEVITDAKSTFANIPILADVQEYEDENGNKYLDYSGHSMHIETDAFDEESDRLIYDEKVVGIVPESNNFEIVTDEETGNDYVYVDALLYRDYGNYVCDILEKRDNKTDVSMEIACDDCSFSAKDKVLDVGKMTACAITLLGEHVTPGMAKAHAEVFSSIDEDRNAQLIRIMQELKESLDNYTNLRKEETTKMQENELEVFEDTKPIVPDDDAVEDTEEETTTPDESPTTPDDDQDQGTSEEDTNDEPEADEEDEADDETFSKEELFNQLFEVSFEEIQYALNALCSIYRNEDEWCYVSQVYDEYFIMQDWDSNKYYKQSYTKDGDNISLSGERIEMFAMLLTESEKISVENMRSNYEEMASKLNKYETEPQKLEILNSTDYSQISEEENFVEFKKQESHFDLTVDEVKAKADEMLLAYAKAGNLSFSEEEKKTVGMKQLPTNNKKTSRYGNLFSKNK